MIRTALYRHYAGSELQYIGISLSPASRTSAHTQASDWFGKVDRIDIEWFESRRDAEAAEIAAIAVENPSQNKAYAVRDTGSAITDMISHWPSRSRLADAIGAETVVVHRWAQRNRIPAQWHHLVIEACADFGMTWVTAAWMVAAHAQVTPSEASA